MDNTIQKQTKNTVPSFAQGTYVNINRLISDGKINAPAFVYLTDKECLGFIDAKKELHVILWDRIESLTETVDEVTESLGDIKEVLPEDTTMADFVTNTTEKQEELDDKVETVTTDVEDIKKNGATILITSDDIGGTE